jgi:Zn-dependent protease
MRELLSWNLSLGRWGGVQVRLHVFFLLFVLVAVNYGLQKDLLGYVSMCLVVLFLSALAHEFGHCVAAWRVGGTADQVLLWPLGGMSHVNASQDPQSELLTALAGPITNLSICVPAGLAVLLLDGELAPLCNPFKPPVPVGAEPLSALLLAETTYWINFVLAIINILPGFPLDGGRALRALLWNRCGYRTSVLYVVLAAKITAVVLCIVAWWVYDTSPFALIPLVLIAIFLFFAAKQEADRLHDSEPADSSFGYDFSQGYTSLERQMQTRTREPGPVRRWLDRRREERARRQLQIEQDEERRVDEILARLHSAGRDGISAEDRALLDRVSARYRSRQRG